MFNSVARYLWGDAEEASSVADTNTNNEAPIEEMQLEVTQDEDWLVVDAGM